MAGTYLQKTVFLLFVSACLAESELEEGLDEGYRAGDCSLNAYLSCDEYAECIDADDQESFTCRCRDNAEGDGFKTDIGGTGCKLSFKPCSDDKECPQYGFCDKNVYKCVCKEGFEGDGYNCTDIDECPNPECDEKAICTNLPGNFSCKCDTDKNYVGDGFTCKFFCFNDNDCDVPRARCNENNTCSCIEGYQGDGLNCTDIDECANVTDTDCHDNSECVNTEGSYKCICKNGYAGDGYNCTELPKNCAAIKNFKSGNKYEIDPDFTGPAKSFIVICEMIRNVVVTKVPPTDTFPLAVPDDNKTLVINYEPDPEDIRPLLQNSYFCSQDITFSCYKGYALFPGLLWHDAYDRSHRNWGSDKEGKCACGEVRQCKNSCFCDGQQTATLTRDEGRIVDKSQLPVLRIEFGSASGEKGRVDIGPLTCADQQFDVPKDCYDAKFNYNMKKNTPLYIDPDGPGGEDPFLVYCDMESYNHVGVTEIPPDSPILTPTIIEGEKFNYSADFPKLQALITGSIHCSQHVEFKCKNSKIGPGGAIVFVTSQERRLDYFPGANGVQDSCGCGATQSCSSPEVKCNCNIEDDQERTDFGLIIDKSDLPVVKVTAEIGDSRSGTYIIGNLRCSQKQFGIEPNCEKLRATGTTINHTYFIDPDGPGKLQPFTVECSFLPKPPRGVTIVHHTDEETHKILTPDFIVYYLEASGEQIHALKNRSTFCTQEISIGCKKFSLKLPAGTINWKGEQDKVLDLPQYLDTCGLNGNDCSCSADVNEASDNGIITDLEKLPVNSLDFSAVLSQLNQGGELSMTLGPLVCSEVFPTCAVLKNFIDGGLAVEGEATVINGKFTIDPDGPGGEPPFEVQCRFPSTIIIVGPPADGLNPNASDPNPQSQCFNITYKNENGESISPAQITALVKKSGKCRQDLTLECKNAPASGHVNFTTCAGKPQPGWAGSFGEDKCACGVNGNCAGGPLANCSCDMADDTVRSDSGSIITTDQLPVCQICFSITPKSPSGGSPAPTSYLKYKLGELTCDAGQGVRPNCQDARRDAGTSIKDTQESAVAVSSTNVIPIGCRFLLNPPVGILVVKAEKPVYPPGDQNFTDVKVVYITINITQIRDTLKDNEYCAQNVYLFCASNRTVELGGNYGWYSFDGKISYDWKELNESSEAVKETCEKYQDLCQKCGPPKGFQLTETDNLPLARLLLSTGGVSVVIDDLECLDIKKSCQHIFDGKNRNVGYIGGSNYVIDTDGPGPIQPFGVTCEFDEKNENGVTEIPVSGNIVAEVSVSDAIAPAEFYLPIEYTGSTAEQADSLTQISEFCWQGIKYECRYSPLVSRNTPPSSYYTLYNGGTSLSFGADKWVNYTGCACGKTGTCVSSRYTCNCDANGRMGVDQGAVTNKDALPIIGLRVGGQLEGVSLAKVRITNLRCSSKPVDPPRDCAEGFKRVSKHGIDYAFSSDYLISPDPDKNIEPFMVRCDFDKSPGNGVTIIKPTLPPKTAIEHRPGGSTDIPYYAPSEEQILAVIRQSAYCYQPVKFDCFASTFLVDGAYFIGGGTGSKHLFWGGGAPVTDGRGGVCACGNDQACGGLDSATGQRTRRCNCDYGDATFRSDAGIIDVKKALPVRQLWLGKDAKFESVNVTFGYVYCSQTPLKFNECEMGFYDCHELATCVDQDVGYRCVCPNGWNGRGVITNSQQARANGRECIDDDECLANKPCPYSANCTNTPGDFFCTCKEGYKQIDKTQCQDINECSSPDLNDCDPNARCENLDGSYRCTCKRGFRGDGKTCIPVGQCTCFGDPHCISYDNRWLHFQGECSYIMSQDGCLPGETPSFRILVEHWKKGFVRPGNYTWIKAVTVEVVNKSVRLEQDGRILVDGILVKQYFDGHRLSIITYSGRVRLRAVTGLEVKWDFKDVVEVTVPNNARDSVCGLCGNFNGDPVDDWTQGPACPEKFGQKTNNVHDFGVSWTEKDNKCPVDCSTPGEEVQEECFYHKILIERECDKLLNLNNSPFKDCLKLKSATDIAEFRKSCAFDLCHVQDDMDENICRFGEIISLDCSDNEKVELQNWKSKVDACDATKCPNNMIYKECGPVLQPTCLAVNGEEEKDAIACKEGCFCPENQIMEGDTCIKPEDCGCFVGFRYLAIGDIVTLPDCSQKVECIGHNSTNNTPYECREDEECRIEDGVTGCYCKEGYKVDENEGCAPDICYGVECEISNMECVNGTCVCKMGFIGDCNQCEDVDECATGQNNCNKIGQACINTPGSFRCQCEDGFIVHGKNCKDIDECEYGIDNCGDNSECVNTLGGYLCECCAGYSKNAEGKCVRDTSAGPVAEKCCACQGDKCADSGKVCGTDGKTYNSYRALAVAACRTKDDSLKVNYKGVCQGTCETVVCDKQYSTCNIKDGIPQCECPTCQNVTSDYEEVTVCATNRITYTSVCHMKTSTCEAEIETTVEVVYTGKPCPGTGEPLTGPWSEWGPCSEDCKQGTRNRTRPIYAQGADVKLHDTESIPCYSTCDQGPCTQSTCTGPGQVCTADENNAPSCECPDCETHPEDLVCGRFGNVIQTYPNECELNKTACEQNQTDYEILEPRACEDKPVDCGLIRNYQIPKDANNCQSDRSINLGECYGGCDATAELCCFGNKLEERHAIMICPNGKSYPTTFEVIVGCACISKKEVDAMKFSLAL